MVERTGRAEDTLRKTELYHAYDEYCVRTQAEARKKKDFYVEMERLLGEMTIKSNNMRDFWRGMKLMHMGDWPCDARDAEDALGG